MKRLLKTFAFLFGIVFLSSACSWQSNSPDMSDPNVISTIAMQTVQAKMTEQSFATLVANATQIAETPSAQLPDVFTATAQPTNTVVVFTNTPTPTFTPMFTSTPIPTATPVITDKVEFVKDVTIPDGANIDSGDKFTKTWQLKNIGTTTWTTSYSLVFVSGNAMGAAASIPLTKNVAPGETVDLSIEFTAPEKAGSYQSYWMLRNSSGKNFGVGGSSDQSFWVKISVADYETDEVPSVKYDYDLAAKICSADWNSDLKADVAYPCDYDPYNSNLWVSIENNPVFENGYKDDERTIIMYLNSDTASWIQGFYPEFEIQSGHHFKSVVGCVQNNEACNAIVSIDIKVDGKTENIAKWTETYDKKVNDIDLDLSAYAGKKVQIIIGFSNKSKTNSEIFWLAPRIVK